MADAAHIAAVQPAATLNGFRLRAGDGFWRAVEQALDNGAGVVFVVDRHDRFLGQVALESLRAAILAGAHLDEGGLAGLISPWVDGPEVVARPLLDDAGRLVDVELRRERQFTPVAEPNLSHREFRLLMDAFLSSWISSTGDYLRRFEAGLAARVGLKHGVATSNGTTSLHLALTALGVGPGDEVIVPDFTFAACANTVMQCGATPVLADVDPESWCLDPAAFEAAITPRTRAVMPVHVFGRVAPMEAIARIARRRGLFVIEDCAEAHGARYGGRSVGAFSDVASFSFFANKIITSGEGGMCLTDDADLAARMRVLRDHGMRPERRYWHEEPGFNYRMTNLQASIGVAQLERMDGFLAERLDLDRLYREALAGIPGVVMPQAMPPPAEPVVWFCCALVPADRRDALIAACRAENIDLRPFFNSLSAMPAYRDFARPCPVSLELSRSGVNLPTSHKIDAAAVARIAAVFRAVLG